jgi:hypothetical protein
MSENLPSGEELAKRFEDEKKKKKSFDLTDPEQARKLEEIARKSAELAEGKKNPDEKIADEVRRTITERYVALGHTAPTLETREDIEGAVEILKAFEDKEKQITRLQNQITPPSGSAPLNDFQRGKSPEAYETVEDMIKDLRKREKEGDASASVILKKLFEKTVQGMKERHDTELPFPTQPEPIDANVKALEVPINALKEGESELAKFGVGRKRKKDSE